MIQVWHAFVGQQDRSAAGNGPCMGRLAEYGLGVNGQQ